MGREAEAFAMINNLFQRVDPFMLFGDHANTFDFILTPFPSSFSSITYLSPLGSSDHCLILFFILSSPRLSTQLQTHLLVLRLPIGIVLLLWPVTLRTTIALPLMFFCLFLILLKLFFKVWISYILHFSKLIKLRSL